MRIRIHINADRITSTATEGTTSLYASPVFSIYVGRAGKHLVAHASVLSKSPTLKRMIDGNWRDSHDRKIIWEEEDEATVHQLLDFLYTGSYKYMVAPSELGPAKRLDLELRNCHIDKIHPEEDAQSDDGLTACLAHNATHNATEGDDVPSDKQHAILTGFTLLQDAKVYVIAHYLELTDLKNLALAAVQNVIDSTSAMRPKLLSNIVELVKYVYNHTDTLVSTKEPLRELVATFAAEWFHVFDRDGVKELMSKGGDSLIDIMEKVQQHVEDLKAEHVRIERDLQKQMERYQKRLIKRGGKIDADGNGGAGHTGW